MHFFLPNLGVGIHFNDIHVFFAGKFKNNGGALFNKVLNVGEQGVNKTIFVNIVTFFTEHVQNFTGGNHTIFNTVNHIGVLGKMANGFGADFTGTLNGNDFFFLNNEFTGVPQNGVQRNDTFFNGIYPFNINDFF